MPQQRGGQRMHIKSDVAAEDGPSTALLKFMEAHVTWSLAPCPNVIMCPVFDKAPYGFEAPKGWQGIRELARAPGGCTGWAPAAEPASCTSGMGRVAL